MRVNRTAKTVAATIAAVSALCWAAYLGRLYATDPAFFVSCLAYGWRDPRFAAFHQLYSRIQPGMTRKELLQAIERTYPDHGPRKRPDFQIDDPANILLFMENGGCEGISLRMLNGRVVSKHYSPD